MPRNPDWLPRRRAEQLSMAQIWYTTLGKKAVKWHVPPDEREELGKTIAEAKKWLEKAQSSDISTMVVTASCRAAFDRMTRFMRNMKTRRFFSPPLSDADFVSLGLNPRSTGKTPVPTPLSQATANITYPGTHRLMLHIKPLAETQTDPRADHGFRIYYGVLPHNGASTEEATGIGRYLVKAAVTGEELPHSRFTRKRKETFEFPPGDSGKTAFFCIRYENGKGQEGPWGQVFSAIIP